MSSVTALVQGQIQEVKAKSLQTLMAVLDEMSSQGLSGAPGRLPGAPRPPAQPVSVLLPPQGNRLTISMGGMPLEVILPDSLVLAARSNPSLLARGTVLLAEPDPNNGMIRLSLPEAPNTPAPATLRTLSQTGGGPSTSAPPPLADFFPPGSPGALIQRLTGLKLPLAERPDAPSVGTVPKPAGSAAALPPALLEAALRAALRQLPVGPTLTAILKGAEGADPALAEALRNLRLDGMSKPDGPTIARSIRDSGLFLEAKLAGAMPGLATGSLDLKGALQALRAALPMPDAAAMGKPALPANGNTGAERAHAATPPAELARMVEGAVERIKLQQIASLPDHPGVTVTDDRSQPTRLALQIPLAPNGPDHPETAMVGLMIEHRPQTDLPRDIENDAEGRSEAEAFPWKVRIAVDLEETGPVQAEIAMRGPRVAVTLWAERRAMADGARAAIGALHRALTDAALDVAHLEVRDGRPTGPAPRHLPLLDRRS